MVFSMNVFKNKKRWKKIKKTLKNVKKRALDKKKRKNVFYIYVEHHFGFSQVRGQKLVTNMAERNKILI